MDISGIASLDFETGSHVDLRKTGVARYAEDPTTRVICASSHIPGVIGRQRMSYDDPAGLLVLNDWIGQGGMVSAWNAVFELYIWNVVLPRQFPNVQWNMLKVSQLVDTMVVAAFWGLPLKLDTAAQALPHLGIAKDAGGHRLMMQMNKPRDRKADTWWHEDEPTRLLRLMDYCDMDVDVERAILGDLPSPAGFVWGLPNSERRVWEMDIAIFQRGVVLDQGLVDRMELIAEDEIVRLHGEMSRVTGGEVSKTTKNMALMAWVSFRLQEDVKSLAKDKLANMLERDTLPPDVREALEIRQEAAKSSVAKLRAMEHCVCADGRMRGLTQYYGAFRSGRWAGRLIQVQNFPRSMVKDQDGLVLYILHDGDVDGFMPFFGVTPMTGLSSALRGCLTVPKGKVFGAIDFAQVEARVTPWLAGFERKLNLFREGKDLYRVAAGDIFGCSASIVDGDQRQIGKVCLAGDTLVLVKTKEGVDTTKPIRNVSVTDLVFDGEEWVSHDGTAYNGDKPCVSLNGMKLTPDHLIWCGPLRGWMEAAQVASSQNLNRQALATASDSLLSQGISLNQPEACKPLSCNAIADVPNTGSMFTASKMGDLFDAGSVVLSKADTRDRKSIFTTQGRAPTLHTAADFSTGCLRSTPVVTAPTISNMPLMVAEAYVAGGKINMGTNVSVPYPVARNHSPFAGATTCWRIWSRLMGGMIRLWNSTALTQTETMRREICALLRHAKTARTKYTHANCTNASSRLKPKLPVYDLVNAGPRRRFTVMTDCGPMLVHNCELALAFGGGKGAFQSMARVYGVVVDDARAEEIKVAWREANGPIVGYWRQLENAARDAIRNPGQRFWAGDHTCFRMWGGHLLMQLPSGRFITYREPELHEPAEEWMGAEITYMDLDQYTRQWKRVKTYGGQLCNNATQGTARDIMAAAMLRTHEAGHTVLASIHDEALYEMDDLSEFKAIESIFSSVPAWAPGLPLGAAGYLGLRFKKG